MEHVIYSILDFVLEEKIPSVRLATEALGYSYERLLCHVAFEDTELAWLFLLLLHLARANAFEKFYEGSISREEAKLCIDDATSEIETYFKNNSLCEGE